MMPLLRMLEVTCRLVLKMDEELREELAKLGVGANAPTSSSFSTNPMDYGNDRALEQLWAIKAMKYAETHMKLLAARDAKELRLTKYDEAMYDHMLAEFKDLDVEVIDVKSIKSDASKAKWREFFDQYDKKIVDYNFGTLLRIDTTRDYSDDNTFIAPRVQFLAIEAFRNLRGLNSSFYKSKQQTTTSISNDS